MKKLKRGFPFFWCFYLLFVIVMVVFWIFVVDHVKKSLLLYEANQPDQKMEEVMTGLRQTGLEEYLTVNEEISRFETAENYTGEFHDRVDGKILFFTRAKGSQDPSAPRYELYADGDLVGYVTLKEASSEPLLVFLTLSRWEVDRVEVIPAKAQESVKVTVPDSCRVLINGQQADQRELTGEGEVPEEFIYAAEYVEVPALVTYEITGLLEPPVVEIFDTDGGKVAFTESRKEHMLQIQAADFPESEMPKELADMAMENARRYSNFFSVDLPGCKNSVSPISDMFPKDSYYLELADTYRKEDMWMYSAHSTPEFKNESVDHYIRYSQELFSCEVSFDKHMLLVKTGRVKVDTTHSRFYYGLLDGEWKILDIKTLLQ